MNDYKFICGRFGVNKNNVLADIETGLHCIGQYYNQTTEQLSEEYTEIKFPENIDGFQIDVPYGTIWVKKGTVSYYFGKLKINYFGEQNKEEQALYSSLVTEALFGNTESAIKLVKRLAKDFYLETEINEFDSSKTTLDQACYLLSLFMRGQDFLSFVQLGAFKGNSNCQEELGHCYEYGSHGVTKNLKIAIKWYKKAAKQNNVSALKRLASIYGIREVSGCLADSRKSFYYLKKAAEQGSYFVYEWLSYYYEKGIGCARNYRKASYWCNKICKLSLQQRENCFKAYEYFEKELIRKF